MNEEQRSINEILKALVEQAKKLIEKLQNRV